MASDPETLEVRGASVLHQDPALLQKSLPREMKADASQERGPDAPIDEYVTFCFLFEHEDRVDLYMGGDPTCLLKQIDGFPTLERARAAASEWVGPTAGDYDFHHMPGIYQTAFVKFANGYQADLDPLEIAWYLPSPMQDERRRRRLTGEPLRTWCGSSQEPAAAGIIPVCLSRSCLLLSRRRLRSHLCRGGRRQRSPQAHCRANREPVARIGR